MAGLGSQFKGTGIAKLQKEDGFKPIDPLEEALKDSNEDVQGAMKRAGKKTGGMVKKNIHKMPNGKKMKNSAMKKGKK